ncbi:hypothetical protein M3Y99_01036700 [Aphelenchoides fujianensis]|nr:hypothetical protein M3Y99_01036700 [Aphelenchoides fujianensis]
MQPQAAADSAALRDEEAEADAAFAARPPSVIWLDESDDEAAESRAGTVGLTETDGEEEEMMIATPSPTGSSTASGTDDDDEEVDVPAPNNVPFDELELLYYRQDMAAAVRASVGQQEDGTIVLSSDEEDGDSDVQAEFDFDDDRMLVDLTDDEDSDVSSQQDQPDGPARQADEDHHSLHLDFDDHHNAAVTRVWVEGMDTNSVSSRSASPVSPVSTTSGNSFFRFDEDLEAHLQNENQLAEEYEEFLETMEEDLRAMPAGSPLPPHLNVDAYVNAEINRREAIPAAREYPSAVPNGAADSAVTPTTISQLAEEMDALIERANFLLGEGKSSAALPCGDEPGFFDHVVAQSTPLSTQSNSPVRIGFGDDDEGFFTARSPRDTATPIPSEGFTYRDETERFRVPRVILRAIRRLTPPVPPPPPQQPEVITLDSEDDVQIDFEPDPVIDVEPDVVIDLEVPGHPGNRPPTPAPAAPQGPGAEFAFDFFDGHFEPIWDFHVNTTDGGVDNFFRIHAVRRGRASNEPITVDSANAMPYDGAQCTICLEETPTRPVACAECRKGVGCFECVDKWCRRSAFSAPVLQTCPLCRCDWGARPVLLEMTISPARQPSVH